MRNNVQLFPTISLVFRAASDRIWSLIALLTMTLFGSNWSTIFWRRCLLSTCTCYVCVTYVWKLILYFLRRYRMN